MPGRLLRLARVRSAPQAPCQWGDSPQMANRVNTTIDAKGGLRHATHVY